MMYISIIFLHSPVTMLCKRTGDALGSRIEVTSVELHLFELRTLGETVSNVMQSLVMLTAEVST